MNYEQVLKYVFYTGEQHSDRTGTGTIAVFGQRIEYDLREGFPLITTKKVHFKSVVAELLWMLRGQTNIKQLHEWGCTIWDEWADENGELGPVYGSQWRNFGGFGVDQINQLVNGIKNDPSGRRHVVSAWNPVDIPEMALPPCHMFFQCYASNDGYLDLQIYQRSADMFLGVPFNIASYALLLEILANHTKRTARKLVWVGGDCHIYNNHLEQVRLQLQRDIKPFPHLHLDFDSGLALSLIEPEWVSINGYNPHPPIKGAVSV